MNPVLLHTLLVVSTLLLLVFDLPKTVGASSDGCEAWVNTDVEFQDRLQVSNSKPILFDLVVNEISDISDAEETFTADFYVSMFYQDPTISDFLNSQIGGTPGLRNASHHQFEVTENATFHSLRLDLKTQAEIIRPTYSTVRAHRFPSNCNFPRRNFSVVPGNASWDWVEYDEHYRGTFQTPFYLKTFPFDTQLLNLSFELVGTDISLYAFQPPTLSRQLNYLAASASEPVGFELITEAVTIENNTYVNLGKTFSKLSFFTRIARQSGAVYGVRIISTLMITSSMTFLLYVFPIDETERSGTTSFLFLASVTYLFIISEDMPKHPYTTRMDNFIMVSLLNNMLCFAWFLIAQFYDSADNVPSVLHGSRLKFRRKEWVVCWATIAWYGFWSFISLTFDLPNQLIIAVYVLLLAVALSWVGIKAKLNASVYELPAYISYSEEAESEKELFTKLRLIAESSDFFVISKPNQEDSLNAADKGGGGSLSHSNHQQQLRKRTGLKRKTLSALQEKFNEIKALIEVLSARQSIAVFIKASDKRDRIRRRISQSLAEKVLEIQEMKRNWQVDSDDDEEVDEEKIKQRRIGLKTKFEVSRVVWKEWFRDPLEIKVPHLTARSLGIRLPWVLQYARCEATESKILAEVQLHSFVLKLQQELFEVLSSTVSRQKTTPNHHMHQQKVPQEDQDLSGWTPTTRPLDQDPLTRSTAPLQGSTGSVNDESTSCHQPSLAQSAVNNFSYFYEAEDDETESEDENNDPTQAQEQSGNDQSVTGQAARKKEGIISALEAHLSSERKSKRKRDHEFFITTLALLGEVYSYLHKSEEDSDGEQRSVEDESDEED